MQCSSEVSWKKNDQTGIYREGARGPRVLLSEQAEKNNTNHEMSKSFQQLIFINKFLSLCGMILMCHLAIIRNTLKVPLFMKCSELRLSCDFINIIIFNFRSPGKTLKSPLLHQCDESVCFGIALCYSIFPLNTKLEILFYIEQRY